MSAHQHRLVDEWNRSHPIGTLVKYWRGAKEGEPSGVGRTYADASLLGSGTPVAWIEGCRGCVALTHVEVVEDDGLSDQTREAFGRRFGTGGAA